MVRALTLSRLAAHLVKKYQRARSPGGHVVGSAYNKRLMSTFRTDVHPDRRIPVEFIAYDLVEEMRACDHDLANGILDLHLDACADRQCPKHQKKAERVPRVSRARRWTSVSKPNTRDNVACIYRFLNLPRVLHH
jgi:hypothetical protein